MIGLGAGRPVFLATGVTDLRRGVNALYALILDQLGQEPLSGALFVFCNRRRDAVKVFCYDEGGVWLCAKRLESGTFRWPAAGARVVELTAADLHLLLSGIDPTRTRLRRWWTPVAPAAPAAPAGVRTAARRRSWAVRRRASAALSRARPARYLRACPARAWTRAPPTRSRTRRPTRCAGASTTWRARSRG